MKEQTILLREKTGKIPVITEAFKLNVEMDFDAISFTFAKFFLSSSNECIGEGLSLGTFSEAIYSITKKTIKKLE